MSPKLIPNSSPRKLVNFYLTKVQVDRLKRMSQKTGLSASEILRRAIDEYWEREKKKRD